jgi:polyisoprenoid-binding protein YceI
MVPVFASAATYDIDPAHSSFSFKVRHLTVSNVTGTFGRVKGTAEIDDREITSLKVEVTLDASSIDTGHVKRDEHLRGPDFFDVAKYPTLRFVSRKISRIDANKIQVTGDLTIRDVTKQVTVDVEGTLDLRGLFMIDDIDAGFKALTLVNVPKIQGYGQVMEMPK